jgi:hypothetical protein
MASYKDRQLLRCAVWLRKNNRQLLRCPTWRRKKSPTAVLRCTLRHCGVLHVRLIPQALRAVHLAFFI